MRRRSAWAVRGAMVAACLAATACTSPDSVRRLSAAQGERLQEFSERLHAALDGARADRRARLTTLVKLAESRLADVIAKEIPAPGGPDWVEEERQRIATWRAAIAANDAAYASFTTYLDEVLVPSNAALDAWHNRPGVSLVDSDAVAEWALAASAKGVTLESVRSLRAGLEEETKGEAAEVKKQLAASFDASREARELAEHAMGSLGETGARLAEIKAQLEALKAALDEIRRGGR